jgi:hypothetical protein
MWIYNSATGSTDNDVAAGLQCIARKLFEAEIM